MISAAVVAESIARPPAVALFDLGGVLVDVDLERSRARWHEGTRLGSSDFDRAFFDSGLKARMDRDPLDLEDLELLVNRTTGCQLRGDELRDIWSACIVPRPDALALVQRVAKRARVGVISDTDPFHAAFIRALPELGAVEAWTFSFEVGALKPSPAMYRNALTQFGVEPDMTFFVDDRTANVAAARALGMRAAQVTDAATLRSQLAAVGLVHEAG